MERPEGSLKRETGVSGAAPAPAGDGVAGTAVAVGAVVCAGAAGGAGVEAAAGAGVEGVFDEDAAALGVALGYMLLECGTSDNVNSGFLPLRPCRL
jgi:hypothetical protein